MKPPSSTGRFVVAVLFLVSAFSTSSGAQGRVVINEYMPWTPSACGAAAEFVELLNFGPGPVNIGCYILTDGDYSVTIPPNTVLQPGEFFVLSGLDIIPYPCANIDSTIHSDLNWTTCNCTSGTIPTTGDGFLTDGGYANEQLVLLDPNLNIIDAVARSLPVEPSSLILTSSVGSGCTPSEFNLDLMTINYETIGESAGRGNSFARRLDGDCGWVKDPQQSGNATNNTPGDVSDVSYDLYYTNALACPDDGSIVVTVHAASYGNIFPMSYTLAFDSDDDGIFEITDSYTFGTVTNPNTISISNLVPGTYRLTVASVNGCYLHTFPIEILDCIEVLSIRLLSFAVEKNRSELEYRWSVENPEELQEVILERSVDGISFLPFNREVPPSGLTGRWDHSNHFREEHTTLPFFRLLLKQKDGKTSYSPVVKLTLIESVDRAWPNPVKDLLYVQSYLFPVEKVQLTVYNSNGSTVIHKIIHGNRANNLLVLPVKELPSGIYQLSLQANSPGRSFQSFRFVKL